MAGVPLVDAEDDVCQRVIEPGGRTQSFDGVAANAFALARAALYSWVEWDCPVLDATGLIDMDAPLSKLPRMLLAVRRSWSCGTRRGVPPGWPTARGRVVEIENRHPMRVSGLCCHLHPPTTDPRSCRVADRKC
jgi:hypothetical protein